MKITSLGHTECLIEIPLRSGDTFRLLLDSWLSDFSVADCMERAPKVKIDWAQFPKIDVIFISHSHMDHLDPYFLSELYQHQSPLLLLAESLNYLKSTIQEYLPENARIEILKHLKTQKFANEVELTGIIFVEDRISNEDDVMTLFVAHGGHAAFFEIDTVPPMIYEEQQKLIDLFLSRPFTSRVYIHSNNELEGNLKLFDYSNTKKRNAWMQQYTAARKEEIREVYTTIKEHEMPLLELWKSAGFQAICIGQGLQYPQAISEVLAGNKFFGLEEVAILYKKVMNSCKIQYPFQALLGGNSLDTKTGTIVSADTPWISFKHWHPVNTDHQEIPYRAIGPLQNSSASIEVQEAQILQALNTKFLPTKVADASDSLKQILILEELDDYIIEVRYGNTLLFESRCYAWGFSRIGFERIYLEKSETTPKVQEVYFANDLVDFLEGRLELYCNFIQTLDPKLNYRFWSVLGADFINHDVVIQKYRFHFERAKSGKNPEQFVMHLYQKAP